MLPQLNARLNQKLLSVLLLVSLSTTTLGFNQLASGVLPSAGECAAGNTLKQFSLDGVYLQVCLPFLPDIFNSATSEDLVQSAYAENRSTGQQFFLYAVPYGLQPAADNLPPAQPGIASKYQHLSAGAYQDAVENLMAQTATLFSKYVAGRTYSFAGDKPNSEHKQETIWVSEAGGRVWMARLISTDVPFLSGLQISAANLDAPSISLRVAQQPLPLETSATEPSASDLPFPSWWHGDCDSGTNGFPGSYPLGSSYRGVKTCGPKNTMHLVRFQPNLWGEYEWQCVEYVMRFIYLAYGIAPYSANGNMVVKNYPGSRLQKVTNGTANKGPFPGDVISYDGPGSVGHTSLVIATNIDGSGNGTVTIAEQNYSNTGTRTHTVTGWFINSTDRVNGWLHDYLAVDTPPTGFTKCGVEGSVCSFSGNAEVVYGALNSFTDPRLFKDGVDCNNAVFGDPVGGLAKSCYSKTAAAGTLTNWAAKYYSGQDHWLNGDSTSGLICEETLATGGLDKNYGTTAPCGDTVVDDWVAEYNATITFAPGTYVFQAQNDDGIKVWVNNLNIFDRASSTDLSADCPGISLSGSVPVRVILREVTDSARVRLAWSTDSGICTAPGTFSKIGPANGITDRSLAPILSWGASRNVNTYEYCIDNSNNSACDTGWQSAGSLTSKTISGLAYGSTYYWQAHAVNNGGEAFANSGLWWSFTTIPDPTICYPLTLVHSGNGSDPSASPSAASGCPAGQYHAGDQLTLTAYPATDHRVDSWTGSNNDANRTITNTVTMPTQAITVAANYTLIVLNVPATISPTGIVPDDYHPIYKWYASEFATSYLVSVINVDTYTPVFTNRVVPATKCTGTPAICVIHPLDVLGNYNYAFQVSAVRTTQTTAPSAWRSFFIGKRIISFRSVPGLDGHVRESLETSNAGGAIYPSGPTLNIGDDALKRQYKLIITFDTSSLPDNAVILSAKLILKRYAILGTNPFSTHGPINIDIKKGFFGSVTNLQLTDFSAPPDLYKAGLLDPLEVSGYYSAILIPTAFPRINKLGQTQLRLGFQLDDDNDLISDMVRFYSGEAALSTNQPELRINYYIP